MPNLVEIIRQAVQAAHPGATVVERGRNFIRHQYAPDKFVLDTSIGTLHYLDVGTWQEINTDWVDTAEPGYTDENRTAQFLCFTNTNSARKIVPRREVPGEYFELARPQYWTGSQWRNFNMPAHIRNGKSLSWDTSAITVQIDHSGAGQKFTITLKDNTFATNIRWQLTLTGLTFDNWQLISQSDGVVVTVFHVPTMRDANRITRTVAADYSGGFITFTPDYAGLVYPIVVDPSIDTGIGSGLDDVHWGVDALYENNNIDLSMCANNPGDWMRVGLRFTALTFSGTIDVSYLKIKYDGGGATSTNHIVYGDDEDNPTQIASKTDGNSRAHTDASVNWTINTASGWWQSPSINSILTELVGSYTISGDAIQFLIYYDGVAGEIYKFGWAYDQGSANAAQLHIEYTTGGGPASPSLTDLDLSAFPKKILQVNPGGY